MKTEALLEDGRHAAMSDNLSEASSAERDHARIAAAAALAVSSATDDHNKPPTPSNRPDHFLSAFHGNGLHQREHEDRVEALQVCTVLTKYPDRGNSQIYSSLLDLLIFYTTNFRLSTC